MGKERRRTRKHNWSKMMRSMYCGGHVDHGGEDVCADVGDTVAPGTPPLGPPWGLTVRPQVGTGWAGVSAPGGDIYVHM